MQECRDHAPSAAHRIDWQRHRRSDLATPSRIRADRDALALALRNLLDNASKYSPNRPRVSVSVETARALSSGSPSKTEGAGIPKDEQRAIFRKFARGSSARALNVKGTGIGLAMAEQIVKAHGGRLELESEPGAAAASPCCSLRGRVTHAHEDRSSSSRTSQVSPWPSKTTCAGKATRQNWRPMETTAERRAHVARVRPDSAGRHVAQARRLRGVPRCATRRDRHADRDADRADAGGGEGAWGWKSGADDYVTKPYSARELRARVKAHLRRERRASADVYRFGDAELDFSRCELRRAGQGRGTLGARVQAAVGLRSPRSGRLLTRAQLLDEVWGRGTHVTDRVVDNQVTNLRKKIEPDPSTAVSRRAARTRLPVRWRRRDRAMTFGRSSDDALLLPCSQGGAS